MKLGEYVEEAEEVYAVIRDGRGRVENLAISKNQVVNALVPQELEDKAPKWKDRHHLEMIVYPFTNCGWYFKINRHYYPSNNKVGYAFGLVSSDINPKVYERPCPFEN